MYTYYTMKYEHTLAYKIQTNIPHDHPTQPKAPPTLAPTCYFTPIGIFDPTRDERQLPSGYPRHTCLYTCLYVPQHTCLYVQS